MTQVPLTPVFTPTLASRPPSPWQLPPPPPSTPVSGLAAPGQQLPFLQVTTDHHWSEVLVTLFLTPRLPQAEYQMLLMSNISRLQQEQHRQHQQPGLQYPEEHHLVPANYNTAQSISPR